MKRCISLDFTGKTEDEAREEMRRAGMCEHDIEIVLKHVSELKLRA